MPHMRRALRLRIVSWSIADDFLVLAHVVGVSRVFDALNRRTHILRWWPHAICFQFSDLLDAHVANNGDGSFHRQSALEASPATMTRFGALIFQVYYIAHGATAFSAHTAIAEAQPGQMRAGHCLKMNFVTMFLVELELDAGAILVHCFITMFPRDFIRGWKEKEGRGRTGPRR